MELYMYKLTVLIDGNFSLKRVISSELSKEEALKDFMVEVVKNHDLDHPSDATFEFSIREIKK